MIRISFKRMGIVAILVLVVFVLGFAGGMFCGGFAAGRQKKDSGVETVEAFPVFDLGEFKLSLLGDKFADSGLVRFELVLELQNDEVNQRLDSEAYWRALFRNEVISESMSHNQNAFRTPEGLLRLTEAIAVRLNEVGPVFPDVSSPVRRVLLKSFVMQ